jgi:hypothetical protein
VRAEEQRGEERERERERERGRQGESERGRDILERCEFYIFSCCRLQKDKKGTFYQNAQKKHSTKPHNSTTK